MGFNGSGWAGLGLATARCGENSAIFDRVVVVDDDEDDEDDDDNQDDRHHRRRECSYVGRTLLYLCSRTPFQHRQGCRSVFVDIDDAVRARCVGIMTK